MIIYIEYILDSKFYQDEFTSWDAYHEAIFNPCIEMKRLVVNNGRTVKEIIF